MSEPVQTLTGRTISHYAVRERLDSGGMGTVYRAHDERLERDVAFKVVSSALHATEAGRRRFRREALSLSKLNHPNIATVYDFDTSEGLDFIAMELVTGPTLSSLIDKGPLPAERVLQLGRQIADGLDAAHRVGIVHRDIKPANVRLTPEGQAKILDFGLAQLLETPAPDATMLESLTGTGLVVGTLPYMAPEQLRGDTVDARTDIYSLGAVLYEMTTGRRPHVEPSAPRLIDAILNGSIQPPSSVNRKTSADLQTVILKALDRNPERRYQSAKELSIDLARVSESGSGLKVVPPPRHRLRRIAPFAATAAGGALMLALAVKTDVGHTIAVALRGPSEHRHERRQVTFSGYAVRPSISPDGRFVAYRDDGKDGESAVLVQDMLKGDPVEIFKSPAVWDLRWSPDGSQLLVSTSTNEGWATNLIPLLGGKARKYPGGANIAWAPDGSRFAFANADAKRIGLTNLGTGDTTSVGIPWSFQFLLGIDWSPDGKRLLLATSDNQGRYALWTLGADGLRAEKVFEDSMVVASPRWSTTKRDEILFLQTHDYFPDLMKLKLGERKPARVFQDLRAGDYFSFTRDGSRLVFSAEERQSNLWALRHHRTRGTTWVEPRQLTTGTFWDANPSVAPDGRRIAFARGRWGKSEIFTTSLDADSTAQITFLGGSAMTPVWSPDGSRIAFGLKEGRQAAVWSLPSSGGTPRRIRGSSLATAEFSYVASYEIGWDPAPNLVYLTPGNRNFAVMDPAGGSPQPILRDESLGWVMTPRMASDGDRVVFGWNRTDLSPPRQRLWIWTISTGARKELPDYSDPMAQAIRWSLDGRRLYIRATDPSTTSTAGSQGKLLTVSAADGSIQDSYELPVEGDIYSMDVTPDGQTAVCAVAKVRSDIWIAEKPHGAAGSLF